MSELADIKEQLDNVENGIEVLGIQLIALHNQMNELLELVPAAKKAAAMMENNPLLKARAAIAKFQSR